MTEKRKIVFFGTPEIAADLLTELAKQNYPIDLVVTQPDRPAGRGQKLRPSPVKTRAQELDLSCIDPEKLSKTSIRERLVSMKDAIFVVVAYGKILKPWLISAPHRILNLHASLLPRWRGAAPVHRSIMAGDTQSGVSIMKIVPELDAGDVLLQKTIPIDHEMSTGDLFHKMTSVGAQALIEALDLVNEGKDQYQKQDPTQVCYAHKISVAEAQIDWSRSAWEVHNHIRGLNPFPGAYTFAQNQRIKIFKSTLSEKKTSKPMGSLFIEDQKVWIQCQDQCVEITQMQREGKSRQSSSQFITYLQSKHIESWNLK
ncbi:MAG: methionyl-tRNA formyltransferase [Bdellovibrionales bacterium]|nr:methionyl-tRNA formyltransferase [Bdellovibrionales bacterium]